MNTPPAMVSRACISLLGTPARTAERLKASSRTAVHRVVLHDGRSVVVKLYAHTARRNAFTETAAIRAVETAVPVPRVLGCGTISSEGATALVLSDLGTRTLGAAVRAGRVPYAQALRDLGGLLARLHRGSAAQSLPQRRTFESLTSLTRRCSPDLLDHAAPALAVIADTPDSTPTVWCHGDLHFDNVVLSGPRNVRHLVDFTDAAPGRRESDVAHTLVMTAAHAPWDRAALTGSYPMALNETRLSAWVVVHTVSCLAHATPGSDRDLWSSRLDDLTRQTPHLFRAPHKEGTRR